MHKRAVAAILGACMALSSCASVLTPARCTAALSAAHDAQGFLDILMARFPNIEPVLAGKLAAGLAAGVVTLQAACNQANPPAPAELNG